MEPVRLVVFDCDGTLVDSQHNIVAAMQTAFRACGFAEPEPQAVRRTVGLLLREAIAGLLPVDAAEMVDPVARAYRDAATAIRLRHDHDEPLFDGARDALLQLRNAGMLLGVATGKSRRGLVRTLARHGLDDLFVTLKTADDGPGKPNPEILLDAMAEAGATPASTVMIGDTVFDIRMAVNASALSVGVAWGYHDHQELAAAGANRMVTSYPELARVVAELWEAGR